MRQRQTLSRRAAIVGAGSTPQALHPGKDRYRLALDAIRSALADGGVEKGEIDGVLTTQQFDGSGLNSMDLSRLLGLNPRIAGQLDYSTAGYTTQYAAFLVATGVCETVLCAYGRNPPGAMTQYAGAIPEDPLSGLYQAAATAAFGWTQYSHLYGHHAETLGHIVVGARQNARLNPEAAFTDPLSLEDYLAQPYLIWPLREGDICKLTAGAVAVIITTPERAAEGPKAPVLFEGVGRQEAPRKLENDDHFMCRPMRLVADQVYSAAGMTPADIHVLAVYDGHSSAVVHTLENYGFCGEGEAADFVAEGKIALGGSIPVNPHGGHLSGGYLVGWTHHVELVRQLRGEAGPRQVPGARVAQFTTTGRIREDYCSTIYSVG
jgi:acetyl-CoA acetyltransferase